MFLENLKKFFSELFSKKPFTGANITNGWTGANIDTRTEKQKEDDVHFGEIVATVNEPIWTEKTLAQCRSFPVLNQKQSYTCGAFSLAKALGILFNTHYDEYLAFSRERIYQRRFNRPDPGMSLYDMFRIADEGVTLEIFRKSKGEVEADFENMPTEKWMDDVGKTFATTKGVFVSNDIDTIASIIQTTGKGVVLLTYFTSEEWSREKPTIISPHLQANGIQTLRHFVVAVDAMKVNGVKCLAIEDSAHFGGFNRRIVTQDWVKNRVIGAGYPMRFRFQESMGFKPVYDQVTIKSAQEVLRYEGLFPNNISLVENIGPVTRKALVDFQRKYKLPVTSAIDQSTKSMLTKLYP